MSNVTFHSKGPCFPAYVRTSGPEKSATRIPNLQATTTQLLKDYRKDSFSRGIASCSLQLLLGVMNAQAIHDMLCPLVHKQWHVHDALDSGPQHLMWVQDLTLSYSKQLRVRLLNMQFRISAETGPRHHFTKHPHRVAASHLQVSTILLWIMYLNVHNVLPK